MKVPIDWLKELVSFRAGPDQLAQMLTMGGLETVVVSDDILEVDILPNRSDCWSIRGIAREVSALTKFKTKSPKLKLKETGKKVGDSVRVEVREKELCPRYMARVISNVKVVDSPEWLKKRLEQIGLRPINNVVDVTNYLLHEIGQPMHAFDASLIKDQHIIVRKAGPCEKIVTLDGKEHTLEHDMLVIADPEKAIAVAGVMGAENTEVSAATRTIILESAYFNPISIHKTSKQIKIRTDSSVRFEHGADWNAVEEALDRAAALIAELGRGEVARGKVDVCAKDKKPKIIELRLERLNHMLGAEVPAGDVVSILTRLGFGVKKTDNRKLKIGIPLFRAMDIEREIDVIEEVARIWGYSRIPGTMPDTAFSGKQINRADNLREQVRIALSGCGLNEVQTYGMLGLKEFEKTGLPSEKAVKITNPLTMEMSILRSHLLPGLLNVILHNQNRQVENIFIFEIGKVFTQMSDKTVEEKWHAGGVVMGSPFMSALDKGEADYFYVKGILENLCRDLALDLPRVRETENILIQPGKGAEIDGLGYFGSLHPNIQRSYEFNRPVLFFEIDLDALFKLISNENRCRPLPKYPFIARDVSMFIPPGLENQMVIETIKKSGGELIENVFPFDKYKDSIAYRVIFRHPDRTLTEEEVNAKHQEIIQALTSKLAVRIR
jgi:phenylalanyl-tRNA synthetase beta chain